MARPQGDSRPAAERRHGGGYGKPAWRLPAAAPWWDVRGAALWPARLCGRGRGAELRRGRGGRYSR